MSTNQSRPRPLHGSVRPHSPAEQRYLPSQRRKTTLTPEVIVSGIQPHPEYDVGYQGGKTIPNLIFTLFYLGGDAQWQNQDRANVDQAISAAMSDTNLNNVVRQYFNQPITSTFRPSSVLSAALPSEAPLAVSREGDW